MATPFINICGLKDYNEARAALDCGTTALGFLVNVEPGAKNQITANAAKDIISGLPRGITCVLATHLIDAAKTAELVTFTQANTVHIGNNATPDSLRRLRNLAPHIKLMKSIHINGKAPIIAAHSYADIAHALVLDSRTDTLLGGTGIKHDWAISHEITKSLIGTKIYLAGGLNPENVLEAILRVHPAGVDVSSGVEDANGCKCKHLMRSFIDNARKALSAPNDQQDANALDKASSERLALAVS